MDRIIFVLLSLLFSSVLFAQTKVFQAGAASLDVTPFLGVGIVGNYGAPPVSENIHDPLSVKAIVLDDGNTRLAIVIVDNLGLHAQICQEAQVRIAENTGIPIEHVLIAATHTHSGPSAVGARRRRYDIKPFEAYPLFLIQRMTDAVKVAIYNMSPARIGFGSFEKPEYVFNRRWKMRKPIVNPFGFMDSVMMNPGHQNPNMLKPAGPVDPEVAFIAVESKDGEPIAVLANYSLHYVGGSAPSYGVPKNDISADYYGAFAKHLTKFMKKENQRIPFVGIMSQGTSGDINNIDFSKPAEEFPPYEKIERVAYDIAKSLSETYKAVVFKEWVPLKVIAKDVPLQVRKASPELLENIVKIRDKKKGDTLFHRLENIYLDRLESHQALYPNNIPVKLQAFTIGDIAISAIPFEVFAETGLELKRKNPFKNSFTLGIANGYWGYLPTPQQHKRGGYETWLTASKVQIDASEILTKELIEMFKLLQ